MGVYENKFIGKLHERDLYYIEKMVNKNRSAAHVSKMTAEYSPNKDFLDICPGSIIDGILLIEAVMEETKKYNMLSNLSIDNLYIFI